jgi:O-antigen/teichoic acid export membrane protein
MSPSQNEKPQQSVGSKARKGIALTASGQLVKQVFEFLVGIAMARLLSPREFGVMGASSIFIGFVAIFTSFGVSSAIIQRGEVEQGYLRTAQTLSVVCGCCSTMLLALCAPWIGSFFHNAEITDVIPVLSLMFLISSFNIVPSALLTRRMQFNRLTIVSLLSSLTYGVVSVILAFSGAGVWSLIFGTLASLLTCTLASSIFSGYVPRFGFNQAHFRELVSFGGMVTVSSLLNHVARNADNLIVGRFLGPAALGLYSRAYSLATTTKEVLVATFGSVLFPSFARLQEDRQQLAGAYLRSIQAISLISLPVCVLLFLAAPEAVLSVYGAKWLGVVQPLRILSLAGFVYTLYIPSTALLLALGKTRTYTKLQLCYSVVIVLSVLAVAGYGIETISLAVSCAILVCYVPYCYTTHTLIGVRMVDFFVSTRRSLVATACAAVMFFLVSHLSASLSPVAKLVCEMVSCVPVYLSVVLLLGDEVALEVMEMIKLKLRRV